MASNDGQRLLVFGLGFRDHDTRKMHRILDHYERLPDNANQRVALYTSLASLARETPQEEITAIELWLSNGGDFPFVRPIRQPALGSFDHPFENPGRNGLDWNGMHLPEFGGAGDDGDEDEVDDVPMQEPPPMPHLAPARHAHRRRPPVNRQLNGRPNGEAVNQGFGGGRALDHPVIPVPPAPRPQGRRNLGGLDPMMGHGPPVQTGQSRSMFDIVGPGRRLGEEGEDTVMEDRDAFTLEDAIQYENTFNALPNPIDQESPDPHQDDGSLDDSSDETTVAELPVTEQDASFIDPSESLPKIECEICCEEFPSSEFPSPTITLVCKHPAGVCYSCLEQCISVQIQEGVLGQLNCPSCPEKLSYEDIRAYASPDLFARYDYLLSRSNKDMFMCLATNCGAGQIHSGGKEQPLMICNACSFKICTYHGRPWHEDQTCAEFDVDPSQIERLEEEEATAKLLASTSKICPACHQGVSKDFGCDHMACRCGKTWCFICEADWENIIRLGGSAHASTCMYNPNFVRKRPDQIAAEKDRAFEAVHGGTVSKELRDAREEFQANRRAAIRPKALEAAEKRMQEMNKLEKGKKEERQEAKKRKVLLKAPWEESAVIKKTFS